MQDKGEKTLKQGLKLPGEENDNTCCWVVPLNIGVIVIGILIVIWGFECARGILAIPDSERYGNNNLWVILSLVAAVPVLVAAGFYIKYFTDMENEDNKAGTVKACQLIILSALVRMLISIARWILDKYVSSE